LCWFFSSSVPFSPPPPPTAEKGEAALAHGAKAFVELLREIDRFDLEALRAGPVA
jgi:creatinine amidohydrolase/Fe(II)-dependent formamide hydrolase-like protein